MFPRVNCLASGLLTLQGGNWPNIWSRREMEFRGKIVREKLAMLFRDVVLFVRNEGGKFGKVLKEKLTLLFHHFILFVRNVGGNRGNDNDGVGQKGPLSGATAGATGELRRKFKWPYVMNSSVAMHGPIVSGTWIWHHQHSRWHHGYYRTRR